MRMILFSALEDHDLARKFVEKPLQRFFLFLAAYLEESMDRGIMKKMNRRVAARLLFGMAYYIALLREIFHDPVVKEMPLDEIEQTIMAMFHTGVDADVETD